MTPTHAEAIEADMKETFKRTFRWILENRPEWIEDMIREEKARQTATLKRLKKWRRRAGK